MQLLRVLESITYSPLLSCTVNLSSLTAADFDWVKIVKGPQSHPRDGHPFGRKAYEDTFTVIKRLTEIMHHRNHQRIISAAKNMNTCSREDMKDKN